MRMRISVCAGFPKIVRRISQIFPPNPNAATAPIISQSEQQQKNIFLLADRIGTIKHERFENV